MFLCCWRIWLVCLALELVGPCVVLGFSVGMEAFLQCFRFKNKIKFKKIKIKKKKKEKKKFSDSNLGSCRDFLFTSKNIIT